MSTRCCRLFSLLPRSSASFIHRHLASLSVPFCRHLFKARQLALDQTQCCRNLESWLLVSPVEHSRRDATTLDHNVHAVEASRHRRNACIAANLSRSAEEHIHLIQWPALLLLGACPHPQSDRHDPSSDLICSVFTSRPQNQSVTTSQPIAALVASPAGSTSRTASLQTPRPYPNPGYLGHSSHTTLFGNILGAEARPETTAEGAHGIHHLPLVGQESQRKTDEGARLVEQFVRALPMESCTALVEAWLEKGTNLALAAPFTRSCLAMVKSIFSARREFGISEAISVSSSLLQGTCTPVKLTGAASRDDITELFSREQPRWEALCLFCTAVARAASDSPHQLRFVGSEADRKILQEQGMELSDRCLDLIISLDCMNDLQAVLQYENFIAHSHVHGDQSKFQSRWRDVAGHPSFARADTHPSHQGYMTWKRLGDAISSVFALGYHEQMHVDDEHAAPTSFLLNLRRSTFARVYSIDKNVGINLGRPPRVRRSFCKFSMPFQSKEHRVDYSPDETSRGWSSEVLRMWKPGMAFDYAIDTQWAMLCALLKEDILEHSHQAAGDGRDEWARLVNAHSNSVFSFFLQKCGPWLTSES